MILELGFGIGSDSFTRASNGAMVTGMDISGNRCLLDASPFVGRYAWMVVLELNTPRACYV
jgi:hypothetical protein